MKTIIINLSILFITGLAVSSCSSKNEEGAFIPSTALTVSIMDLKSMQKELTWEEIKNTGWYQTFSKSTQLPDWTKKVLGTPEQSGINFKKSLVIFSNKNIAGKYYWAAEGSLENQRDFDQFNKEFSNAGEIKITGKVSTLLLSKNQLIGWDDSHFVYISTNLSMPALSMQKTEMEVDSIELTGQEMIDECLNIFQLKEDNSLAKNKPFSALLKEDAAIKIWVNGGKIMKSDPGAGITNILNTDVFFNNNISTFAINFNKGVIDIKQHQYASKEFINFLKKNLGSNIKRDMAEKIPSQDIMAILALNLKPEGLQNLVKLSGAEGLANMFLQKAGFNLEDLSKANNGNFLIAISEVKNNQTENDTLKEGFSEKIKMPVSFKGIFAIGVNDKPSFQKIIDGAGQIIGSDLMNKMAHIKLTDKTMVISNSEDFANEYLNNQQANSLPFIKEFTGHPVVAYLDLQKLISLGSESRKRSAAGNEFIQKNLQMWQSIMVNGGEIKEEALQINIKINLMDKNTSSLKQLNSYLYSISELQKKMEEEVGSGRNVDSLLTPPLPDTVRITDAPKK